MTIYTKAARVLAVAAVAATLGACATSKDVDKKIADAQAQNNKKIESVEGQIEDLQNKQKATDTHLAQTDQALASLSQEAKDALARAEQAGVLAKGKVVFEKTFNEDRIHFKSGKYDLDKAAKAALDEFAGKVKALNEQYYIEIQGHTDNVGGAHFNDDLGEKRAEEVRRYLARADQLPLQRMSTISYGQTLPVGPNKTRKGRAENRRVVVVVMQ